MLTTDLKFVRSFGTQGSRNGQFVNPRSVVFDDANNLYVTDSTNNRVQVLTTEGQFLRAFSQTANGQKLKCPWFIAIDSSNTVYVSDDTHHCVSVFSSEGDYITMFGEGESTIVGLSVDHRDSILVSALQLHIY